MKTHLVFLSFLLFGCLSSHAQGRSLKDLVGKWQMEGNFGSMEFDSTEVITTMQGKKVASGKYIIDFSKSPHWLDVTVAQGRKSFTLKQILEFVDDDTIRWQTSNDNERPKAFGQTAYGGPLTLTRQK